MIQLNDEVRLVGSDETLGRVIAFHTAIDKALVALPAGGTIRVPIVLLTPNERPVARKSAPRRRT